MEAATLLLLGCDVQLPLKPADFVDGLLPKGVVGRSGLRHALTRSFLGTATRAGPLPSSGVTRLRRYYEPLGLPLATVRFRSRLIRTAITRRGSARRVSRVPPLSFSTCCSPYPAETSCPSGFASRGRGLRRDMRGSALGL